MLQVHVPILLITRSVCSFICIDIQGCSSIKINKRSGVPSSLPKTGGCGFDSRSGPMFVLVSGQSVSPRYYCKTDRDGFLIIRNGKLGAKLVEQRWELISNNTFSIIQKSSTYSSSRSYYYYYLSLSLSPAKHRSLQVRTKSPIFPQSSSYY